MYHIETLLRLPAPSGVWGGGGGLPPPPPPKKICPESNNFGLLSPLNTDFTHFTQKKKKKGGGGDRGE